MKTLLLSALLFICLNGNATTYYFAASGNDANNGTSASSPFKSITKFNSIFSSTSPGDQFLFNRGDVFYGAMVVSRSGSAGAPMLIGAYGTGANPVITGLTNVTAWSNLGNNIWESTNSIGNLKSLNLVVINGVNTAMGRTPNTGTMYHYQSHTGYPSYNGASAFSITSTDLSGTPDWTGAELATYVTTYGINRVPITSQSGGTLNWIDPTNLQEGFETGVSEFFIQNDPRTLDQVNEWYYNSSTHKIRIYNTVSPAGVAVASIDTLLSIGYDAVSKVYGNGYDFITFDGLCLQGSNSISALLRNSKYITFQNCLFQYGGRDAINNPYWGNATHPTVKNCSFSNINNTAIGMVEAADHATITGNNFQNTGSIIGMGAPVGDFSYTGLYSAIHTLGVGSVIQNNVIHNTGYTGITMRGDSSLCQNNLVDTALTFLHDGGGIYTWNNGGGLNPHYGMKIQNNIVLNVANDVGIYCDDNSNGIEVSGNTMAHCANGLYVHNNWNMNIHDNVGFDNSYAGLNFYHDIDSIWVHNIILQNNTWFAKTSSQYTAFMYPGDSVATATTSVSMNNNFYARPINDSLSVGVQNKPTYAIVTKTLAQLQTYTGRDKNSLKAPQTVTSTGDLILQYNATASTAAFSLPNIYIDVKGTIYNGSITLAPFQSAVLIKKGPLANQAPKANAGPDQTITLPVNFVSLNGSGTDSNGTIASYAWTKLSGPSSATMSNATSSATTVSALTQGVYQFQLKVTDNSGANAFDTIQITVNAAANIPPVANAGINQSITLPTNYVSLIGSGTDAGGTIASYAWTKISGPSSATMSNATSSATTVSALTQGVYQFQLKVTDNSGANAFDTIQVIVNAAANLVIANAGSDQSISLPTNSVSLRGSGTSSAGTIKKYAWTKISGAGVTIFSPYLKSASVKGLLQGVYLIQLAVTDSRGIIAKDTMMITVTGATLSQNLLNTGRLITSPDLPKDNVYQNFPNPFISVTTIRYEVANDAPVRIDIFNASGIQIVNLLNENKKSGVYEVQWQSAHIVPGMYFYTVHIGNTIITKKMMKFN